MDNSYSIEELIEMLEDLLSDATHVPFGKKSLVDVNKMSEVITDMRMVLPMEIQQAQKVVLDKNNIIAEANREAESIIRKAEQRRAELLEESDLVKEARRRATEMLNDTQNRCIEMRKSTEDYADKLLRRVEDLLSTDLNNLKTLRSGIIGTQNEFRNAPPKLQPVEKPGPNSGE